MRAIRRTFTVGCVLSAAAVTFVAAPAAAGATQTTSTSHAVASTAPARHAEPDGPLRSAMLATVGAGATGMIARVDDGDQVTRIGVGAARLDPRQQIRTNDQVRVGSITKSMVATVTLQLVGEGRLHLSDTVAQWLPGLVPGGDRITLQMLLNHTSGIYNYTDDPNFFPTVFADPYRDWSPRELVAIATSHPLVFPPGSGWSYSNTGYILIGLILEKATGSPIQTLLDRRVITPLHLKNTYFATTGLFRGSHAHGYLPPSITGNGYADVSGWSPSEAWAAGALVSNAPDLAVFYSALLSGRLLKPWLLRQMTTTVESGRPGVRFGLGILSVDTPCGQVWGHDGGIPGYLSYAYADPHGSRSTVVTLPTQPNDAILTATQSVLDTAECMMLRHPALPGQASSIARNGSRSSRR